MGLYPDWPRVPPTTPAAQRMRMHQKCPNTFKEESRHPAGKMQSPFRLPQPPRASPELTPSAGTQDGVASLGTSSGPSKQFGSSGSADPKITDSEVGAISKKYSLFCFKCQGLCHVICSHHKGMLLWPSEPLTPPSLSGSCIR